MTWDVRLIYTLCQVYDSAITNVVTIRKISVAYDWVLKRMHKDTGTSRCIESTVTKRMHMDIGTSWWVESMVPKRMHAGNSCCIESKVPSHCTLTRGKVSFNAVGLALEYVCRIGLHR